MTTLLKFNSDAERCHALRQLYHEADGHPNLVHVSRLAQNEPGRPSLRVKCNNRTKTAKRPGQSKPILYGGPEALPDDLHGLLVRRNLTLFDNGMPILQRLGPRRRNQQYEVRKEIKEGRKRLDKVLQKCKVHRTSTDRMTAAAGNAATSKRGTKGRDMVTSQQVETSKSQNHRFHFGAWYAQGQPLVTATADTMQEGTKKPQDRMTRVLRFMLWLRNYVKHHVQPLVDAQVGNLWDHKHSDHGELESETSDDEEEDDGEEDACAEEAGSGADTTYSDDGEECAPSNTTGTSRKRRRHKQYILEQAFRDSLEKRAKDYDWLVDEFPVAKDLCHPLYSTCSPFVGFSGNAHIDKNDSSPTILLNFGYARLHLPEYHAVVDLHPGEVVFFNSASVKHYTAPHPGYPGPVTDRWAVSCFFQTRLHKHMRPDTYPIVDLHRKMREIINNEKAKREAEAQAKKDAMAGRIDGGKENGLKKRTREEQTPHEVCVANLVVTKRPRLLDSSSTSQQNSDPGQRDATPARVLDASEISRAQRPPAGLTGADAASAGAGGSRRSGRQRRPSCRLG